MLVVVLVKCMMQLVVDVVNPVKSLSNREATSQFTVQTVFAVCEDKFLFTFAENPFCIAERMKATERNLFI